MAERMRIEDIMFSEKFNSGTSVTGNEEFDANGYLYVKKLVDPKELYEPAPKERGQYNYHGDLSKFSFEPVERQVEGSIARYYYTPYKHIHTQVRLKLEKIIGKKLYNTYYYDRYYFPGQELTMHTDRASCEISVTINISTNLKHPWPIKIKTPDVYSDNKKTNILTPGEVRSISFEPGDGVIYKGCERPHWRDKMPSNYGKHESKFRKIMKKEDDTYYHQVFFHYVLADGNRVQHAFDAVQ
jgi:hypothetical protein